MVPRLSEFINSCEWCIRRKMPKVEPRPVIQPIEVDHSDIGGTISYDFKGPLPTADKTILHQHKSRYVLVIIDHSTRYVMAHPTPTMEANLVAEIMISRWIPCFGVPRTVISDRARSFTGSVMKSVYGALEVDMQLTAAYNPSCNGLVEQVNRNISSLLMVMLEEGGGEWPKKLNLLFSAYNASPQTSTGYSPNFLVYGRELVEPIDIFLRKDRITNSKGRRVIAELEEQLRLRRCALELLQLKFEETNTKRVEQSKGIANVQKFQVGELVGFRAPPSSTKLCKYFEIDHRVIKIVSDSIKNESTGYERIINARKLRKINTNLKWNDMSKLGVPHLIQSDFSDEENDNSVSDDENGCETVAHEDGNNDRDPISAAAAEKRDTAQEKGPSVSAMNSLRNNHEGEGKNCEQSDLTGANPWNLRLRNRHSLKKPVRL